MTANKATVLVVEDEHAQREILLYNLKAEGFFVLSAADGDEALLHLEENTPDLILLDWMLPKVSGIEICRRVKKSKALQTIPVIMLSARCEEFDRVRGLETGADDYVVKTYSVVELMARVRGLLRRTRASVCSKQLTFEDIVLDSETYRVTRDGLEVKLGPTEFRLLSNFMEKPLRVWSREQLLDRIWGQNIYVDTRTVDVHIGRLRKALCKHGGNDPIRTVRSAGYSLG